MQALSEDIKYHGTLSKFSLLKDVINNNLLDSAKTRFVRESQSYPHHNTSSWFLRHTASFNIQHTPKVYSHSNWNLVPELWVEIKEVFKDKFNNFEIVRALVVNLPAGTDIPIHLDAGDNLMYCHRCHVPIITNDNVIFTVNKTSLNMKEGEIHEINNSKHHSVHNNGTEDRYHLIFDIEEDFNGKIS